MLMLWSKDLPVQSKNLRDLPMKPHPQTPHPHAPITLSTPLYWRTRDSRKYPARAIQHLVSEVHKIEGGGPSSDQEQAASDWPRTNEGSQRGLQPGASPSQKLRCFSKSTPRLPHACGASSPLWKLTRRLHSWVTLRVQRPLG